MNFSGVFLRFVYFEMIRQIAVPESRKMNSFQKILKFICVGNRLRWYFFTFYKMTVYTVKPGFGKTLLVVIGRLWLCVISPAGFFALLLITNWSPVYYCVCVSVNVHTTLSKPPPSSCLSTSLQSHSPPSPCQSPCQYPIRTRRRRQPSSSVTTPVAPWSPPPPSSPPPSQTPASCHHSNRLCRGTPCRQGYHSDQPAQVTDCFG